MSWRRVSRNTMNTNILCGHAVVLCEFVCITHGQKLPFLTVAAIVCDT